VSLDARPSLWRAARAASLRRHAGRACDHSTLKELGMNLAIWLPGLFLLGLVSLWLCFLFLEGCERI
jgi:hypothetical protein